MILTNIKTFLNHDYLMLSHHTKMQQLSPACCYYVNLFMKLLAIFIIITPISCHKMYSPKDCMETGTLKKGSTLGLLCTDALFIVRSDNKIIQPVISHDILVRFFEGDSIRFGYIEIFLRIRSCGVNIETAELTCVVKIRPIIKS